MRQVDRERRTAVELGVETPHGAGRGVRFRSWSGRRVPPGLVR